MNQRTTELFFALLRSAILNAKLTKEELELYSIDQLKELFKIAVKHDLAHLLALGLKQNGLIDKEKKSLEKYILKAVYRYEKLKYDYDNLLKSLENAKVPFVPLKGSILRKYYPEEWMRTSCDIDILVHSEDLERAINYLTKNLNYQLKERSTHDVSLFTENGTNVELHFDLVEEGRAVNSNEVLSTVWQNVSLFSGRDYQYEMSDAFFYFYHIAHIAKHFETGGSGIRPIIDLYILNNLEDANFLERENLINKGGLTRFNEVLKNLSEVWFLNKEIDALTKKTQDFIIDGGLYGTVENRVVLGQKKKGGKVGYVFSRIFISYEQLKRYYPILEKHKILTPFMQVRRWFSLLKPGVFKMAKKEIKANKNVDKENAKKMKEFLDDIGLK